MDIVSLCPHFYNRTEAGHFSWLSLNNVTDKLHYDPVTSLYEPPNILCSPGWSVSKTDGAHKLAQIFHIWLLPTKPGPAPADWSHSSHYLHHTPERQFISNLGLYSDADRHTHTLLIGLLSGIGTPFSKSFHIHVPDWMYCVGEWWFWLPLLARCCFIVSISTPESLAFLMADVARGHPDRLEKTARRESVVSVYFGLHTHTHTNTRSTNMQYSFWRHVKKKHSIIVRGKGVLLDLVLCLKLEDTQDRQDWCSSSPV